MIKVAVLGANGQLGSDLLQTLKGAKGIEVTPLTRSDVDVEDLSTLGERLSGMAFDYLINCTSYHKTDECEDYPEKTFRVNSVAVNEMAKACHRLGKVFVHFSTDYVFDGAKGTPYTEEDCTSALNVYGASKAAGEQLIRAAHDRYFMFRVSSLFGVAGSSGKGGNFVETMIRLAREGKPMKVVDDQIMSPTHTLEIARAVTRFIEEGIDAYGVYHCAGTGATSWYRFTVAIMERLGLRPELSPVRSSEFKVKAKRPAYSVLDHTKLDRVYKMPRWEESLDEYLQLKGY